MPCRAPSFWWTRPGIAAQILRPAAGVYRAASALSQKNIVPYAPLIPVICVGNVVAGGAGKTPAVQALTALLFDAGITKYPSILLRGYGGALHGPTAVDPAMHGYKDVGDEAILHAAYAPTIIARDRAAGVKLAQFSGADMVIMDDGLQNPSVKKTISFLMVDGAQGIGNGMTLPAGPLREPLAAALKKTDAIILNGDTLAFATDKPIFRAHIAPASLPDINVPYIAFAGLGRPEKFRNTLGEAGVTIAGWHPFPDHHPYRDTDLQPLIDDAAAKGAVLITTEKDAVRIPEFYRNMVKTLPVRMAFDDPAAVVRFMREKLGGV